jgi:uncharacterized protein YjbI with pentapeptide repeats
LQIIEEGEIPRLPDRPPRHDDAEPGVSFFRTMLADAKIENLTLRRTYFGRSEIRNTSFKNTDLGESTGNWNDFIDVDFTGADLSGSDVRACLFERVRFKDAILAGVDFRYCGFKGCNFSGADLTDAKLTQKAGMALGLTPEQQSVIDWQAEDGEEPEGG